MWVRSAAKADINALSALLEETVHATYDDLWGVAKTQEFIDLEYNTSVLEKCLARPYSEYVVVDGGQGPVGAGFAVQSTKDLVVIEQLYICPAYQRQGFGKSLLREILESFPEVHHFQVMLPRKNRCLHFFNHFGFFVIKDEATQDVVILEKVLEEVE
ncbi:N-acetyltransferase family protein [Bartonella sp. DGB2]|uniref:GNAT family N-acetyltransferase n=1 Tax=Bartonella sp. DGB2 TaxID=3388426 RepID=UPI00398FE77C